MANFEKTMQKRPGCAGFVSEFCSLIEHGRPKVCSISESILSIVSVYAYGTQLLAAIVCPQTLVPRTAHKLESPGTRPVSLCEPSSVMGIAAFTETVVERDLPHAFKAGPCPHRRCAWAEQPVLEPAGASADEDVGGFHIAHEIDGVHNVKQTVTAASDSDLHKKDPHFELNLNAFVDSE